jgi:hypothetical protein
MKKPMRAEMNTNGLWLYEIHEEDGRTGKRTNIRICAPFQVVGKVATEDDQQHSLLLEWKTKGPSPWPKSLPREPEEETEEWLRRNQRMREEWARTHERELEEWHNGGVVHRMIVNSGELHSDAIKLIGRLSNAGLAITHSRNAREKFAEYLSPHFDDGGRKNIVLLPGRGWSRINGHLLFAHEQAIIKTDGDVEAVLKDDHRRVHGHHGTLDEWQQRIGNPAREHRLMVIAICVAASGPLIKLVGAPLFGVHLWGPTSTGKTTLLCGAASFWGDGDERGGFIQPWTSTINSLEKRLELASDTLLPIDDLGAADPYPFFSAVYRLFNGVGRGRLTSAAELREQSTWATPVLSTGEIRPQDKLEEIRNRSQTGGQEVRMVALHVQRDGFAFGAFDTPGSKQDAATLSKTIKEAARQCYGTAGLAFVERLAALPDREAFIRTLMNDFAAAQPQDMSAEVRRVADHFALLTAAGELLIELQIVDWPKGTAREACQTAFDAWVADRGATTATHAELNAVELLRHALTVDIARFKDLDNSEKWPHVPNPLWGYVSRKKDEVWFETAALKDLFPGMGGKNAIDGLKAAGLLKTTSPGSNHACRTKSNQVYRTPKDEGQRLFYVVSLSQVLDGEPAPPTEPEKASEKASDDDAPPFYPPATNAPVAPVAPVARLSATGRMHMTLASWSIGLGYLLHLLHLLHAIRRRVAIFNSWF